MNTLYCSLVRPLLEYSCETWNPHTKRNIDKLEAVQPRATRWITRSDDDYDASTNWTVCAITRALKWLFFSLLAIKISEFLVF